MHVSEASPRLAGLVFRGNRSARSGGGLFCTSSSPTLVNVTFDANSASYGGGVFCGGSACTLVNAVFNANTATTSGGGMYSLADTDTSLVNVTFHGNTAQSAGGIYSLGSTLAIRNSVLWGNSPGQVVNLLGIGELTIADSLVEGGCPGGVTCSDILTDDPLFVDVPGGDLHLQAGWPAINAGDNSVLPADTLDLDGDENTTEPIPFDRDGNWRVVKDVVDIGAYERPVVVSLPLLLRGFP